MHTVNIELDFGAEKDNSSLYGRLDRTLKVIEETLGIETSIRGSKVFLNGPEDAVRKAEKFIQEYYSINSDGYTLSPEDVKFALKTIGEASPELDLKTGADPASLKNLFLSNVPVSSKNKFIVPRSETQKKYIDEIRAHDMVFGIGPAGTGKTYLAMAMAINALLKKEVSRIVLARPAVEAGEKLGFLPGDISEKVIPTSALCMMPCLI